MRQVELQSLEQLVTEEIARWDADEATATDEYPVEDPLLDGFEEVHCGERWLDLHRWELDPASAEDYRDRTRVAKAGPALRWRHFGH